MVPVPQQWSFHPRSHPSHLENLLQNGLVSTREGEDLFTRQVHPLQQGAASRGFVRVDLPLEDRSLGIVSAEAVEDACRPG